MTLPAGRGVEVGVVIGLFVLVTVLGWAASRWRRPESALGLDTWGLEDWGLGGRAFGSTVTFFLMGGDLYTAYTLVAVPALVYGLGAPGFFAVAYVAIMFPMAYLALPRLWSVAHTHGFVTSAEFVRARFGSRSLSVLVAVTAMAATMPYIALQLIGLRVVFETLGIGGDLPLVLAFGLLAFFTFNAGLRAPALIAIVKDLLLLLTVLMLVLWVAVAQGGWGHVFQVASVQFTQRQAGSILLPHSAQWDYVTLALGSALALFLYPHAMTGVLAARDRATIKRSVSTLPVYSIMLALFALFGFAAVSAGTRPAGGNLTTIAPRFIQSSLNGWGGGLAFAALSVGALVPASIMSIGAANLFTRSIYREFIRPSATPAQEAQVSRFASLVVKFGALIVILLFAPAFSINLQLMGGVVILQVLPAVGLGLYTNWFHGRALIAGLAVGLVSGAWMLYQIPSTAGGRVTGNHFGGSAWPLSHLGLHTAVTVYAGLIALGLNLAVTAAGTLVCRWRQVPRQPDLTRAADYTADAGDERVQRMAELVDGTVHYQGRHVRPGHMLPLTGGDRHTGPGQAHQAPTAPGRRDGAGSSGGYHDPYSPFTPEAADADGGLPYPARWESDHGRDGNGADPRLPGERRTALDHDDGPLPPWQQDAGLNGHGAATPAWLDDLRRDAGHAPSPPWEEDED